MPRFCLLPGLDGTGALFAPFVSAAPRGSRTTVIPLPADRARSYAELADALLVNLPDEDLCLVAESFSGPLALLLATRQPRITRIVLVASFVTPPWPRLLANVPAALFGITPPIALVAGMMTGGDTPLAEQVLASVARVPPDVIASRIVQTLRIDARAALRVFAGPLLYLRATRDRLVLAGQSETITRLAPAASIVPIDAPHLLLQTRPREAWEAITRFVGEPIGRE